MLHANSVNNGEHIGVQSFQMLTKIKNNYWSAVASSAFDSSALSASLSASTKKKNEQQC